MPNASPQLTLVVAATLANGIGAQGALPWRLPREMAYFAKVTREGGPTTEGIPNAVIMGRKTWESIPRKFRPLKDRLNVVISRTIDPSAEGCPPCLASSLDGALSSLPTSPRNIFVIGGASIYEQALRHPSTTRILLTRILEPAYEECDVFFPEIRSTEEWTQAEHAELEKWAGFEVAGGVQEEKQTKYEFQMWVRNRPGGEQSKTHSLNNQ